VGKGPANGTGHVGDEFPGIPALCPFGPGRVGTRPGHDARAEPARGCSVCTTGNRDRVITNRDEAAEVNR
jgi:hypothetical protein